MFHPPANAAVAAESHENRPAATEGRKLSVVFFGRRAAFSSRCLHAIAKTHHIAAVVESEMPKFKAPPKWKKWFSRQLHEDDIEAFAKDRGIPYFRMTKNRMTELAAFIAGVKADIGFISMMAHLLPESIIQLFPRGILNTHPSLLPLYRGPVPLFWTLYNEEHVTGVTIHFIDAGEDTGDIVRQKELAIGEHETATQLAHRCADLAAELAPLALNDVADGTVQPKVQRHLLCPCRARGIKRDESLIDWKTWPVSRVYAALRAAYPTYDLMPPRPFPYNLCDWVPTGITPQPIWAKKPHFVQRGFRFCLATARGLVHLRPKWSMRHFKRGLHDLIRRPTTPPVSEKPSPAVTRPRAA